jgi:hypothetical protein
VKFPLMTKLAGMVANLAHNHERHDHVIPISGTLL